MARHHQTMCEHGYIHSQCRCPDPNKVILPVGCDNPDHALAPKPDELANRL